MSKVKTTLFVRKYIWACVGAGMLALTFGATTNFARVSGAGLTPPVQQGGFLDAINREKLAIVGSWNTPDPEGTSGTITFHADGTLTENDVDHTFAGGNGTWAPLGGRQYAYTFIQHKKDDQEQHGFVTVYGTVTLDSSGNHFTGPLHFEFANEDGTVVDNDVILGLTLKLEGSRIQIRQ